MESLWWLPRIKVSVKLSRMCWVWFQFKPYLTCLFIDFCQYGDWAWWCSDSNQRGPDIVDKTHATLKTRGIITVKHITCAPIKVFRAKQRTLHWRTDVLKFYLVTLQRLPRGNEIWVYIAQTGRKGTGDEHLCNKQCHYPTSNSRCRLVGIHAPINTYMCDIRWDLFWFGSGSRYMHLSLPYVLNLWVPCRPLMQSFSQPANNNYADCCLSRQSAAVKVEMHARSTSHSKFYKTYMMAFTGKWKYEALRFSSLVNDTYHRHKQSVLSLGGGGGGGDFTHWFNHINMAVNVNFKIYTGACYLYGPLTQKLKRLAIA